MASPFAQAEDDGTARRLQSIAHDGIRRFGICFPGVAPVVFEVVDAPVRVLQRVLIFVALAAGPLGASQCSGIRINPKLQALVMNIVGQRLDARRKVLRIRNDTSDGIAIHLPAVVDHHVLIAGVFHPAADHRVSHALDQIFADVAVKFVPAVPAHGRGESEPVVPSLGKRRRQAGNY